MRLQYIYGITLQLPTSDQVKVMLERGVFKNLTNTLLWHKADIFQAERSLTISDIVFDKTTLTKEKLYCQINEKNMLFSYMFSTAQ